MGIPYLTDLAKQKIKEEIAAVKKMQKYPYSLQECIEQQKRITERIAQNFQQLRKISKG